MKFTKLNYVVVTLALLALFAGSIVAAPSGTAFTYQGRLTVGANVANGNYDLNFSLYDALSSGSQVGSSLTNTAAVSNGLFTVTLDFGASAFNGDGRWLEIGARTNGSGAFTTLSPRQKLTPTPYAITAGNFTGTLPSGQLAGTYGSAVTFNNAGNSFTGSGAGLTSVNAATLGGLGAAGFWQLAGNAGTTPGLNFLGTTDNQPLEFKVNGNRTLRLDVNGNIADGSSANSISTNALYSVIAGGSNNIIQASASVIGGGHDNTVQTNAANSTIAGGRYNTIQTNVDVATIGGGEKNTVQFDADATTISGGSLNTIQTNADYATIGGGYTNTVGANSSTVAGGRYNTVQTNANSSTISGGRYNTIQINAYDATIGGGVTNTIWSNAYASTIGGGNNNTVQTNANNSTIGGGAWNLIQTNAFFSTVGGGLSNTIQATATYSTISGGRYSTIQTNAYLSVIGGGYNNNILSNAHYAAIPGGMNNVAAGSYSFAFGNGAKALHDGAFVWGDSIPAYISSTVSNSWTARASGGVRFFSNSGATVGVQLAAGGNAWSPMSDRNVKENFQPVDQRAVLEKVCRLPVTEWNLISQPAGIRHIGPMAQDFQAAFGVGEDDRHISTSDADGVAFAAIQGLNQKVEQVVKEKNARIQTLEKDVAELKAIVNSLLQKSSGGAQ
jgi:hypothetical protein